MDGVRVFKENHIRKHESVGVIEMFYELNQEEFNKIFLFLVVFFTFDDKLSIFISSCSFIFSKFDTISFWFVLYKF